MTRYIVVSSNEIVKAEMERPDEKYFTYSAQYSVDMRNWQNHCLSLPRIAILGKHNWKVWQEVVEGKDFELTHFVECSRNWNCDCEPCQMCPKPAHHYSAIPIQSTPEVIDFALARQAVQTEIASNKEYEKYCQELETLWRDIDLILDFADPSDTQKIKMIKDKVHSFNKKIKL